MFVGFWPRFLPPALGRFWMLGRLEHFALGSWLCKHFAQDAFTRDFTIPCRRSRDKTCYLQRSFVFQQSNLTTYSMLRMLLCKIVVRLKVPASPTVAQRCLSPNPGDSVGKSSAVICGAALYALGFPAQNRHATRNNDLKFWKTRRHEASQLSAHGHQCLDRIWHHRAGSQPDIHLLCYRTCRGQGAHQAHQASRSTRLWGASTSVAWLSQQLMELFQGCPQWTLFCETLRSSNVLKCCSHVLFPMARNQDTAKHLPCIHL